MTGQPTILTDEAGAVLTDSIDERVYFVRSKRWIAYPKAVEILGHLNALLQTFERHGCHRSLSMATVAWASPCWSRRPKGRLWAERHR